MRIRELRKAIVAMFLCLPAFGAPAEGSEPAHYNLEIDSQPLNDALQELARQSGVQIIFFSKVAEGITAPSLKGRFTAAEAVAKLLNNSQLTFRELNPRTIEVRPTAATNLLHAAEAAGRMLASDSGESAGRSASSGTVAGESRDSSAGAERLPPPGESAMAIPEMLVIGHRSINADIERTEDDAQPYVVFDREQIQRSMSPNLEDFFKTRLPMNTVQDISAQSANVIYSNQSQINLRGLGTNQTLILVDGRRMPRVNAAGSGFRQADVNGIPLSAIERIEVLPSTASGIHGGGATGGVINIITRKDYRGIDLTATYGNVFDGDAASQRLDASAGFALEGGRTRVLAAASYATTDELLIGARDFVSRGRDLQLRNNADAFYSLATPPVGYTTNIRSVNGSNLVLDNGTPLNAPRTFVPVGYTGVASDNAAALLANAGQYNLDPPDDLNSRKRSLLNNPTITSVALNARRAFGERVEAFLDMSRLDNKGRTFFANVPTSTTLAADAPNNPFTTPIAVSFPAPGLSYPFASRSETLRAVGGLILRLPHDWTTALDHTWSRSRFRYVATNPVAGDPDGAGPGLSVTTALSGPALDPIRDLNLYPLDFSPYLLASPNSFNGPLDTILEDTVLRLTGPVFRLPAGPVSVTAMVGRSSEDARGSYTQTLTSANVPQVSYRAPRSQTVDSYYLEAQVPLVAASNDVPLVRELELQASVRHDEYETIAGDPLVTRLTSRSDPLPAFRDVDNHTRATKHTFGLRYSPVQDLVLRASVGTGFLPPSIDQLVPGAPIPFNATLIDPKRGGVPTAVSIQLTGLGSPDLLAEESRSWSIGAIFTPRFIPGLRWSVDYTRIEKTDEISSMALESLVQFEDWFPGRVTRDPLTPEDAARGYTGGVITAVNNALVNFASMELEAFDVQIDYEWQTETAGDFHFFAIATWQPYLRRQATPNAPLVDSVGHRAAPLELRANGGLNWTRGRWTLGWSTQYYDGYLAYFAGSSATTIDSTIRSQGGASIPSQIYHDLFARYRFAEPQRQLHGLLSNLELMIGIENVFDDSPPILATTDTSGGYSPLGDPRLRRYTLSIRKAF